MLLAQQADLGVFGGVCDLVPFGAFAIDAWWLPIPTHAACYGLNAVVWCPIRFIAIQGSYLAT